MANPEPLGAGRAHRRRTPPACRACEESARAALGRPSGLLGQRVRRLVVSVVILLLPVEVSADLAAGALAGMDVRVSEAGPDLFDDRGQVPRSEALRGDR